MNGGADVREYNDYVRMTRDYLKNYTRFKATIENLQNDLAAIEQELKEFPIQTVQYDKAGAGGPSELTPVERAAEKRQALEEQARQCEYEKARIELLIRKIDRSLACLPEEQQKLIREHYFQRKTWIAISHEMYLTADWASEKARRAVKDMAFTMFGEKALPPKERFIFSLLD